MKKYTSTKNQILDVLGSLFLGLGCISLISPAFFYWWIHGDYDRYIWIISGPAPYSYFGSGPFQLWVFFITPIIATMVLLTFSYFIRKSISK